MSTLTAATDGLMRSQLLCNPMSSHSQPLTRKRKWHGSPKNSAVGSCSVWGFCITRCLCDRFGAQCGKTPLVSYPQQCYETAGGCCGGNGQSEPTGLQWPFSGTDHLGTYCAQRAKGVVPHCASW